MTRRRRSTDRRSTLIRPSFVIDLEGPVMLKDHEGRFAHFFK